MKAASLSALTTRSYRHPTLRQYVRRHNPRPSVLEPPHDARSGNQLAAKGEAVIAPEPSSPPPLPTLCGIPRFLQKDAEVTEPCSSPLPPCLCGSNGSFLRQGSHRFGRSLQIAKGWPVGRFPRLVRPDSPNPGRRIQKPESQEQSRRDLRGRIWPQRSPRTSQRPRSKTGSSVSSDWGSV